MEVTSGGRRGNSGFFFRLELVANFIAIDKGSEKFKSSVSDNEYIGYIEYIKAL